MTSAMLMFLAMMWVLYTHFIFSVWQCVHETFFSTRIQFIIQQTDESSWKSGKIDQFSYFQYQFHCRLNLIWFVAIPHRVWNFWGTRGGGWIFFMPHWQILQKGCFYEKQLNLGIYRTWALGGGVNIFYRLEGCVHFFACSKGCSNLFQVTNKKILTPPSIKWPLP